MSRKISRRRFLKGIGVTTAAASLAACGSAPAVVAPTSAPDTVIDPTMAPTEVSAAAPTDVPTATEAATAAATEAPSASGATDTVVVKYPPFDKYSPTKLFTEPRGVASNTKFIEGDAAEETVVDRFLEEQIGVKFSPKFLFTGGGEYREKLNLAVVSNDMPDTFGVYPFDLYGQMVEAGALKDITDIWPQAASKFVQDTLNWSNGYLWEPLKIKGRIYGWPGIKIVGQDEKLLWYRTDWLEKLGAKPPTTLDELHDLLKAIVDAKLAGDDKVTVGLQLSKEMNTWINSTDPIFGGFGVMPSGESTGFHWKKMPDGTVMTYSIMPETKEALAVMSTWYKEGLIAPEFFTVDTAKSVESIINGQAGLFFGPYWSGGWPIGDADKNAGADTAAGESLWAYTTIPAGPKGRGTLFTLPVQSSQSISATVSDEDAIAMIKAVNWVQDLTHPSFLYETKWHGFEGYDYIWEDGKLADVAGIEAPALPGGRIDVLQQQAIDAYKEMLYEKFQQDPDQLNAYEKLTVETEFTGPQAKLLQRGRDAYAEALKIVDSYAIRSDFNGIPGAVMTRESKNLIELERAAFIDIIVGNKPISAFDEFVADWKARGGDDLTKEVNDYLAAQQ